MFHSTRMYFVVSCCRCLLRWSIYHHHKRPELPFVMPNKNGSRGTDCQNCLSFCCPFLRWCVHISTSCDSLKCNKHVRCCWHCVFKASLSLHSDPNCLVQSTGTKHNRKWNQHVGQNSLSIPYIFAAIYPNRTSCLVPSVSDVSSAM